MKTVLERSDSTENYEVRESHTEAETKNLMANTCALNTTHHFKGTFAGTHVPDSVEQYFDWFNTNFNPE